MNREDYLMSVIDEASPWFVDRGFAFNMETGLPLGVSEKATPGLPRRRSKRTEALILPASMSDGGFTEIFVAASLSDSTYVVGVVMRCLLQVATGAIVKPNRNFVSAALNLGFIGEKDQLIPGPKSELSKEVARIVKKLGDYPHSATGSTYEPVSTTLMRLTCENEHCSSRQIKKSGYNLNASALWAAYPPECHFCGRQMTVTDRNKARQEKANA